MFFFLYEKSVVVMYTMKLGYKMDEIKTSCVPNRYSTLTTACWPTQLQQGAIMDGVRISSKPVQN